jgi:hypothetical protein
MIVVLVLMLGAQTQEAPQAKEIDAAISRLSDPDAAEREKAQSQLAGLAKNLQYALAALEKARASAEPEVAVRAADSRKALIGSLLKMTVSEGAEAEAADELVSAARRYAAKLHDLGRLEVPDAISAACVSILHADYTLGPNMAQDVPRFEAWAAQLEEKKRTKDAGAEQLYQRILRHYEALRARMWLGDPYWLNRIDAVKARAEQAHGGAARVTESARAIRASLDEPSRTRYEGQEILRELHKMRFRPEFFQDAHVSEMDTILKEAEQKVRELPEK